MKVRACIRVLLSIETALLGNDELKERLQPALERSRRTVCSHTSKSSRRMNSKAAPPGSKGEDLSVKYITDQFKQIGLKPGNPDGTYTQKFLSPGSKANRECPRHRRQNMDLKYSDDFALLHRRGSSRRSRSRSQGWSLSDTASSAGVRLGHDYKKCRRTRQNRC